MEAFKEELVPKIYPEINPETFPKFPWQLSYWTQYERKIILLSKKNLETLRAYKAIVELQCKSNKGQLVITITGLSNKGAKNLFDELNELPPKEIYGE